MDKQPNDDHIDFSDLPSLPPDQIRVLGHIIRNPDIRHSELEAAFRDLPAEALTKILEELLLVPTLVVYDVIDQAAEKRDIGAGADRRVDVAHRAGASEAGIDVDEFRAFELGFHGPTKCDRMIFRHIGAHEHATVGVGHSPVR